MKKRVMAVLLCTVLLAGMVLTGCTGKGEKKQETSGDEKVNLKFYTWSDEESYMTEVVDNYNNSQDKVEVELVTLPSDSDAYNDKLTTMLSAGSDADIVGIRSIDQVLQYQEAGALYDMSELVAESDLDISNYGATWDATYPDGKISAMPTRTTCWMLFYNKGILEKAGITMPEQPTWDDYQEISQKLTSGDGTKYGGTWLDWGVYHALATQKGTYLNDDDLTDVKGSLEYVNTLLNEDKSHVPLAELKSNDSQYLSDFENGRTGMLINGEWLINMLMADEESGATAIDWEVAPMPVSEGVEPGTTWGAFQFAAIPKDAKYPEESFDFMQYMCGDGGAAVLPKHGMLPAYASETAQGSFDEAVGKESASEVIFNAKKVPETPSYNKYNEVLSAFNEHAELYLNGEKDIDETMDNFEKQRQEIMSK